MFRNSGKADPLLGIYPREPRNKKKASKSSTPSTTFYYTKDIQYLLHEPLLARFREHKALSKKIARFLGRGEVGDAARLEKKSAPGFSLDHIIKERYPTFVDALRDLDDALSMLSLFANLPSTSTVPHKTIALCQRLCLEFQHYLILTHSLQKSFLSIKGIYYQATIQGQDIMWLVPHRFVQRVTGDVDFRIMGTFVEFYTTLLGFVNYRLYTTIGLVYPPKFDSKSDEKGAELGAFMLEGNGVAAPRHTTINGESDPSSNGHAEISNEMKDKIQRITENAEGDSLHTEPTQDSPQNDTHLIDDFQPVASDADTLLQPQKSPSDIAHLFAPFTFYLSRETPRQPLEFILRAFGCKRVGWDILLGPGAYTHDDTDPSITHQIVDRPPLASPAEQNADVDVEGNHSSAGRVPPGHRMPGRTYVQPQWVWDCANQVKLLRPDLYAPGAMLPPHLSPWMKPTKGQYDPNASLADQEPEGEAAEAEEEELARLAEEAEQDQDEDEDEEGEAEGEAETIKEAADRDGVRLAPGILLSLSSTDDRKSIETTVSEAEDMKNDHGMDVTLANSDDSSDDEDHGDSFDGFDANPSDSEDINPVKSQHQLELEAEAAGLPLPLTTTTTTSKTITSTPGVKSILKKPTSSSGTHALEARHQALSKANAKAKQRRHEEDEELERRKMMLPRKKRKVYEKMAFGNRRREEEAKALRAKRRKIEKES